MLTDRSSFASISPMENAVQQALSTFRKPPHMYNCAQTVCAACGRPDLVESLSQCGGGKAPEGMCGALYGATRVAPDRAEALIASFGAANGAIHCFQLKREKKVPCEVCVRTAVSLLMRQA